MDASRWFLSSGNAQQPPLLLVTDARGKHIGLFVLTEEMACGTAFRAQRLRRYQGGPLEAEFPVRAFGAVERTGLGKGAASLGGERVLYEQLGFRAHILR